MISYQDWRAAELRGAAAARALHDELGIRKRLSNGTQPIDVFEAIRARKRTLVFQPLKSLLGAYIKHRGIAGLMVTSERDLHIQRFTAAHEFGHAEMDHPSSSLDKEIGFAARGPIGKARTQSAYEVEADAFASEFLLPKWLIAGHIRRRRWILKDLAIPDTVYQLSLRLGASYAATCWALASNSILPRHAVAKLLSVPPKASKHRALGFKPESWQKVDVWLLRNVDEGTRVLGDPHDKLVVELEEHTAGGYVWDLEGEVPGLSIERPATSSSDSESGLAGDVYQRRLLLSGEVTGRVRLVERRPWESDAPALNSFVVDLDMRGPEPAGLPRVVRLTLQ